MGSSCYCRHLVDISSLDAARLRQERADVDELNERSRRLRLCCREMLERASATLKHAEAALQQSAASLSRHGNQNGSVHSRRS